VSGTLVATTVSFAAGQIRISSAAWPGAETPDFVTFSHLDGEYLNIDGGVLPAFGLPHPFP